MTKTSGGNPGGKALKTREQVTAEAEAKYARIAGKLANDPTLKTKEQFVADYLKQHGYY